jgi:rhamnogalacturonyl hydrolase YesR
MPDDFAGKKDVLKAFREHIKAVVKYQDPTGAWHQVIDKPGSYRELTSTCMITFALIRGVRNGWLEREKYPPIFTQGEFPRRSFPAFQTRRVPEPLSP